MNITRTVSMAVGGLLMLGVSAASWAVCSSTTQANSTLEQGGQGNLVCEDFSNGGKPMKSLTVGGWEDQNVAVRVKSEGSSVEWAVNPPFSEDVDAMLVEAADGRRCVYFYTDEDDFADSNLTTASGKDVKTVVACGNKEGEPSGALFLDKTFDPDVFDDNDNSGNVSLGDRLPFTLTVTNTGQVLLTGVTVFDEGTSTEPASCDLGALPVNTFASCVVYHTVTLLDAQNGFVYNTARAVSEQTTPVFASETVSVTAQAPISNVNGKCEVGGKASGLQNGVDDPANEVATVVGIGTAADGNPVVAICSDGGNQKQCSKQCRPPAGFPVDVGPDSVACKDALAVQNGPGPNGELPLECRVCELSSIQPPIPPPGFPTDTEFGYCWELSHQVDESAGTFIIPEYAEETVARARRIIGSTCYEITLNFYGVEYTYYSPDGCPGSGTTTGTQ